jgi:hypothetical protein
MYLLRTGRRSRMLVVALLSVAALAARDATAALEQAVFTLDRLQGDGWQAEGVRVQLALARGTGELRAAMVKLPPPVG